MIRLVKKGLKLEGLYLCIQRSNVSVNKFVMRHAFDTKISKDRTKNYVLGQEKTIYSGIR